MNNTDLLWCISNVFFHMVYYDVFRSFYMTLSSINLFFVGFKLATVGELLSNIKMSNVSKLASALMLSLKFPNLQSRSTRKHPWTAGSVFSLLFSSINPLFDTHNGADLFGFKLL